MSFAVGASKIWNKIPKEIKEIRKRETCTAELSQYLLNKTWTKCKIVSIKKQNVDTIGHLVECVYIIARVYSRPNKINVKIFTPNKINNK